MPFHDQTLATEIFLEMEAGSRRLVLGGWIWEAGSGEAGSGEAGLGGWIWEVG